MWISLLCSVITFYFFNSFLLKGVELTGWVVRDLIIGRRCSVCSTVAWLVWWGWIGLGGVSCCTLLLSPHLLITSKITAMRILHRQQVLHQKVAGKSRIPINKSQTGLLGNFDDTSSPKCSTSPTTTC